MYRRVLSSKFISRFAPHLFLFLFQTLSFVQFASAQQLIPALSPIADPADKRFIGVKEDWSTPALVGSSLRPVQPVRAYISDHDGYTVELLQVQWRWGDPIDLYVLKPTGVEKPPMILYLYGYPSDTETFKDESWQRSVTKDGFAAVGVVSALTGQRYHDRPMREWFVSDLQECLATTAHDVQMVLDYLASRNDLDMRRVGLFSQGSGASIAILASAVDSRIQVLDTIDPWGDWPTWMAQSSLVPEEERASYVKPEFLKNVAMLEPIEWLRKVQAKRFRLQDATFESKTPWAAKQKLREAVPSKGTVVIYRAPEEFNAVIRSRTELEWIQHELRALPDESQQKNRTAKALERIQPEFDKSIR
jgi:hypothetical protein